MCTNYKIFLFKDSLYWSENDKMLENKKSVLQQQLQLILEALEETPPMGYDSALETLGSNSKYNQNWHELVDKLNAVPNGAKRNGRCWKMVLSEWKLNVKLANGKEEALDDLAQRLFCLIQEEQKSQQAQLETTADIFVADQDTENSFKRLNPRRSRKRPGSIMEQLEAEFLLDRKQKCLKTIPDNNLPGDAISRRHLMQMHLDRLHRVSQELESHIQDVQNRIQMIKDRWQHDCDSE